MTRASILILLLATASVAGAQSRTGAVNVGDASINYELTGQGKTVVFIHGWANTMGIWDGQVPVFSQRFRVLRYDRRGFGKSTGFADISADPDDLRILLDSLGIASAYVVGLSAGSDVATRFAFAFPNRIDALVRLSGGPPEGLTIAPVGPQLRGKYAQIAREHGMDSLGKFVYSALTWRPPGRTDEEELQRVAEFWKNWAAYSGRDLLDPRPQSGRVPPARWERIHTLTVPTLLVNGDHDLPMQLAVADSLARRIPRAQKVVIVNAAHAAHRYQPDQFNTAVLDFFASLSSR